MALSSKNQEDFESFLLELWKESNNIIYYVPNEGNAGDALIASGMWCLFDKLNIKPIICDAKDLIEDTYVMYAGGGNLINGYFNCRNFLEQCLEKKVKKCVVLPHTVRGHEDILNKLDSRFTIVAREYETYNWLVEKELKINILLASDLAFNISLEWLAFQSDSLSVRMDYYIHLLCNPKQLAKYLLWILKNRFIHFDDGLLEIIRGDIESTALIQTRKYNDLSNNYGSHYKCRAESIIITRQFLDVLKKSNSVKTNRLHAAIGSHLIQKIVFMHDNSYGKNRAVFNASLDKSPYVTFVEVE
jgi:exopolysaccharide biosynthesis predicted pyruvyltransferase EpsI